MMGFMIFGRGAELKTQGPKPFFLKILLAKNFFFWAQGGLGPLSALPGSVPGFEQLFVSSIELL